MNKEQWWIDYMENEVEPWRKPALDLLLKYSSTDGEILENLQHTKKSVKQQDLSWLLPQDSQYYDKLHDSIMDHIDRKDLMNMQTPWAAMKTDTEARTKLRK